MENAQVDSEINKMLISSKYLVPFMAKKPPLKPSPFYVDLSLHSYQHNNILRPLTISFLGTLLPKASYHKLAQKDKDMDLPCSLTPSHPDTDEEFLSSDTNTTSPTLSTYQITNSPIMSLREEDYDWGKQFVFKVSFSP